MERTKRIDAEFFQKENLDVLTKISKFECETIADVSNVSDGNHFAISDDFQESGIPYYRGQDLTGNFFVEQSTPNFISEKAYWQNFMLRSHLKKGDVLLSIVGTVGSIAIVDKTFDATCSCKIAILRPKDKVKTEYLATFLYSKYGNNQIKKFVRGAVQTGFILEDASQIKVPLLSLNFQNKIADLIQKAHAKLEESKALYAEAENLLLDELGLRDWSPSDDSISVKSFNESFADTGRLDAEYYQPKYDYALERLQNLTPKPLDIVPLESLIKEITNGGTPLRHNLSEGEIPFLTAEHIFDFRINYASEKRILSDHHYIDLKRTRLKQNDIVIAIKGKVGNAAVVDNQPFEANINQDVGLFRLKDGINPYYIVGFLNSVVGKAFVEQISTGQINPFLGLGNLRTLKNCNF